MPTLNRPRLDRLWVGVALSIAALLLWPTAAAATGETGEQSPGETVFHAKNCQFCHSVEIAGIPRGDASEKMQGPDLSKVGVESSVEDILEFLKKGEVQRLPPAETEHVHRETHWKTFWGTDEEVHALADWLIGLQHSKGATTED